MALFFDSEWFDARLVSAGLKRSDLAMALGLSEREIGELWKDQREISADNVRVIAPLLGATPHDVAKHAGVSTPIPAATMATTGWRRIEMDLKEIKALLMELRAQR